MIKPYSNLLVSNCWTTLSPLYNLQNDRMVEANSKPVGSRRVSDFGFRGAGANGSVIGRFVGEETIMNDIHHRPRPPYGIIAVVSAFLIGELLLLIRMGSDILF